MTRISPLPAIVALLILTAVPCPATTWSVPGNAPTIQAGIDLAAVGDTVLVAPGIYTEDGNRDIDFHGKDLVLRSSAGAEATIIDCKARATFDDAHRGFYFHSGESSACRIEGFTITNGVSLMGTPYNGGGISCEGASPTISRCIIKNNHAAGNGLGGGIWIIGGAATIENCAIIGNRSDSNGGGIWVFTEAPPLPTITNCVISGNLGGGIWCGSQGLIIASTTISGNRDGAGVFCNIQSSITLEHSILWGNCNGPNDGIDLLLRSGSSFVTFQCCDVDTTGFSGDGTVAFTGDNVFSDPMFCNPASCVDAPSTGGFYRLNSGSPCLPENNACGVLIGALGACAATSVPTSPETWVLSVFPNPSVTTTQMRYSLAENAAAQLTIFDVGGRKIQSFEVGGSGSLSWDGRDASGRGTPPGIYFLRLEAGDRVEAQRFTRLR